jgi:hypothetical protein
LEEAGIVRRRKLPPPAASKIYELTAWGEELEPVIICLGRWGARSPLRDDDALLGVDSLILSFRTMFDPGTAEGLVATYELRMGEDLFRAEVSGKSFEVERGSAESPDATIGVDSATLAGLVYGDLSLTESQRSGDVKVEGDQVAVERFLTLFTLPEPAALV